MSALFLQIQTPGRETMMKNILAAAAMTFGIAALAPAAQSAPMTTPALALDVTRATAAEPVHFRRYRHRHIRHVRVCRWYYSRRHCRVVPRAYWHGGRVWRRW